MLFWNKKKYLRDINPFTLGLEPTNYLTLWVIALPFKLVNCVPCGARTHDLELIRLAL